LRVDGREEKVTGGTEKAITLGPILATLQVTKSSKFSSSLVAKLLPLKSEQLVGAASQSQAP